MSLCASIAEHPYRSSICKNSSMAQVFISYSYLMIKASVLLKKPGVHVQSEVAAAAAMIKLQPISKNDRKWQLKETVL
jgi:hypothetical protein